MSTISLSGGLQLPLVGLGTFKARGEEVQRAVGWALAAGVRHLDTAHIYKNHAEVGAAVRQSGVPREQVFITSKVSPYQHGRGKAAAACGEALEALGCSYIDLMLVHWPGASKIDARDPQLQDLRRQVLERYQREGRLRTIGVSNYTVAHLEELLSYAEVPPAVNQVECHPRWQQQELRAFCKQHGIAVVAYASLGCGELLMEPVVQQVAASSKSTPAQVLLRWGLQRGCAVIPKSVTAERIRESAPAAVLAQQLSPEQLSLLDALGSQPCKFCWDPEGIL